MPVGNVHYNVSHPLISHLLAKVTDVWRGGRQQCCHLWKERGDTHWLFAFITRIMDIIHRSGISDLQCRPPSPSNHDFSKDEWYFLVTIGHHTLGHTDLVCDAYQQAITEHYRLEPHHPEHETVAGRDLTTADIEEMAVDHLSRNLQKHGGDGSMLNWEQMEQYIPVFAQPADWKIAAYQCAVKKHAGLAVKVWREMLVDKEEEL